MSQLPNCPECNETYTYEDSENFVCPMCGHEWTKASQAEADEASIVRDVNGNELQDGDTVTIIRDLKIKGSSDSIKQGTKVKGIRLIDPVDGHNIDCKVPGFGAMKLKSSVVKKID